MGLSAGTRLGPYEIVTAIGAGGMGEVYRARDSRLNREVAIKVLPDDVAADPRALTRFESEARAVAALSHPNILALHDVGKEGSVSFVVTELLEGETLRESLREGPLPPRKAIDLGAQVADGLAAAHVKGIVHRDLKPENLFVTREGRVKILDFGLARHLAIPSSVDTRSPTEARATTPGEVLGTVGYLSPEQVRGQPADHRSDVFSFGCVLYEMLSGKQAFKRETAAEAMTAVLREEPPTLAVAPELSSLVNRCLEKKPDMRFQSAQDLAFAVRSLASASDLTHPGTPAPSRRPVLPWLFAGAAAFVLVAVVIGLIRGRQPSSPPAAAPKPLRIVVFPFENLGSSDDAYFASGMTEEITSRLAGVPSLAVISRTTATRYDRKGKTVEQVGKDLGVGYILEGTVRWDKSGGGPGRVRVTPQLTRVSDDTHLWSDRYDRTLADVFAIQSEMAESAVRAMDVRLLAREQNALKASPTNDLEAYDLYLRGRELDRRGIARGDVERALLSYQAAVDRDPRFAAAYAGAARMHLEMYWQYYDRSEERLVKAKAAAERAIEIRPDLPEAHSALGNYYYRGLLNYPQALKEFAVTLEIQPNSGEALEGIGGVLRRQGRWSESAEKFGKAAELDPRNAYWLWSVGLSCELAGRYADADRAFLRALALNPRFALAWAERAWVQLLWNTDAGKAQAVLDEAARVPGISDDGGFLAWRRVQVALARRDYQGALRQLEAEARSAFDNQVNYSPIPLLRGQVQMLAGQADLARRSFEAARLDLEQRVKTKPDDDRLHGSLGIAYAGLGQKQDAVREARLGCELMPASKDAFRAIFRVWDLAHVYRMVGETSEAIAALEDLRARSVATAHTLRLDPRWDHLRSDPRFQALLKDQDVRP